MKKNLKRKITSVLLILPYYCFSLTPITTNVSTVSYSTAVGYNGDQEKRKFYI